MGGNHKRPKKHLRFGSLLKIFQDAVNNIKDTRMQEKVHYSFVDIHLFYTTIGAQQS
jgi:hypothetical protein